LESFFIFPLLFFHHSFFFALQKWFLKLEVMLSWHFKSLKMKHKWQRSPKELMSNSFFPKLNWFWTKLRILVLCFPDFTQNSIKEYTACKMENSINTYTGTCIVWYFSWTPNQLSWFEHWF
jgi:hypothetical protein